MILLAEIVDFQRFQHPRALRRSEPPRLLGRWS